MRLCSIASGSSGNCIYVGSDTTHLLVDAGISGKKTEAGLAALELSGNDISGILITHEHGDHIAGLGVLSRKYHIPIYGTLKTLEAIRSISSMGKIEEELWHPIDREEPFRIQDITVDPMAISHDSVDPVAYRFFHNGKKVAVATDMGTYDDYTVECLQGMDALLLEANHDIRMLQVGPYPYYLKQRVLGNRGHLSNEMSGKLLKAILHDGMQTVLLGHLSQENNIPELAYETVRLELSMGENGYQTCDLPIRVASRYEPSEVIRV